MATKKMLAGVYDFVLSELRNIVIHTLASDPGSPVAGQFWYNSTGHVLKFYDGTTVQTLGTGAGSGPVTAVSIATANGFAGTSDGNTSTPTLSVKLGFSSGLVKATASGVAAAATSATDYAPATTGSSALKASSGGFATATINDLGAQTADYSAASHKFTNVTDPTSAQDAATKNYVDNNLNGLSWKEAVRIASTANGTLASAFANGSTVDGVTLATGDRLLLKDQTTGTENGIYTVNASGAPTRALDADAGTELVQATVTVREGTANADKTYTLTNDGTITIGTTSLTFVLSGTGSVSQATTSVAGKVQLATQAEAEAKSDTAKAVVSADLVNFPIKKTATIGDGSSTSIAVTHSLGTKDVIAQVRDASTDVVVDCGITQTSTSVTTFDFATAPSSNAYKVVIVG